MKKIITVIAFIIIIVFLGIFVGYLIDNDGQLNENDAKIFGINSENRTKLTLLSNRPIDLNLLIYVIRNEENFNEYNKETILWIQSLKQKEVFVSNNSYILMNKLDANKIKSTYVTDLATTDTYYEYYIDCNIVENRSLGGNNSMNIIVVKDVKFLGNQTFYYDV